MKKLLLDVDGVVFPYGSIAWQEGQEPFNWDEPYVKLDWFDQFFGNHAQCHMPVRILDALRTLGEHYEIVWASLRGEHARQFEDILGLPELSFLEFPGWQDNHADPKRTTVHASMKEPFAWIDDAAIPPDWHIKHPFDFDIHLEVPHQQVGIMPAHVERLLEFASV